MKPPSLQVHPWGLGAIGLAMTWFASVVLHSWLSEATHPISPIVILCMLWFACLMLATPGLIRLAWLQLRLRRLRTGLALKQAEIAEDFQARKLDLAREEEKGLADLRGRQQKQIDDRERALAMRTYLRE